MSPSPRGFGADARLRVADGVLSQEVAGEAVLLDPERGVYFGLNEVGAAFWRLLGEHPRLAEIHALLAERYDVAPERLRADLEELVRDLAAHGLVEIDPA